MADAESMPAAVRAPWVMLLALGVLRVRQVFLWNIPAASPWLVAEMLIETLLLVVAVVAIPLGKPWARLLGASLLLWRVIRGVPFLFNDAGRLDAGVLIAVVAALMMGCLLLYSHFFAERTMPGSSTPA